MAIISPRPFRVALMAGLLCFGSNFDAASAPSEPLYVGDVNGVLGTVDIATGDVTVVGNTGLRSNLTDIAFQNGVLYGTTPTGLYSIDRITAASTFIASYGGVGRGAINALVGSTGSTLYAASGSTGQIYAIATDGAIAPLAGFTSAVSAGDLAFAGGTLYESAYPGGGFADRLIRITLSGDAFSATPIRDFTTDGEQLSAVYGLAQGDDGMTYAVNGTRIYSVDLTTAELTLVSDYAGHGLGLAYGAAFASESPSPPSTPVPEPASMALVSIALIGLGLTGRRREI